MLSNRRTFVSVGAVAALFAAEPTHAAGRDCTGWEALKDRPVVAAGTIASDDKRVFFVKGETEDKSCPADTKVCQRKAFLVPGDGVVVSGETGAFACVIYVNGKGVETSGWLPKATVTLAAPGAAPPVWPGTWMREEAEITIRLDGKGHLAITGDATYGARDPDRVKRGAVNTGEISAKAVPSRGRLSFTMADDEKTLPVDKGEDTMCKVWMQRVGAFLLVDDNNACGGMNVSFRGTYARR